MNIHFYWLNSGIASHSELDMTHGTVICVQMILTNCDGKVINWWFEIPGFAFEIDVWKILGILFRPHQQIVEWWHMYASANYAIIGSDNGLVPV